MKNNDIFDLFEKREKESETLKKWGDLYRSEKEIIEAIITSRNEKGLSQKQVALLTDLQQSAIARIENGANSPQLNTLLKITEALELKIKIYDPHIQKIETIDINKYDELLDFVNLEFEEYANKLSQTNGKEETNIYEYNTNKSPCYSN